MVSGENTLILVVTRECVFSCPVCPIEKQKGKMSQRIAKKSIRLFLERNFLEIPLIRFFGGEPLLNFSVIKKVVEWTKKRFKNVKFDLTTNFFKFSPQFLKFFRENENVELIISTGDKKFPFSSSLFKLTSFSDRITFNINLWPFNLDWIGKIFKKLLHHKFFRFNFLPAYYFPWQKSQINLLEKNLEQIARIIKTFPKKIYVKNLATNSPFPLFNLAFTIDVSGEVYFGNFFLHKDFARFGNVFKIGDINTISEWKEINTNAQIFSKIDILKLTKIVFPKRILDSTFAVDKVLNNFCERLKT